MAKGKLKPPVPSRSSKRKPASRPTPTVAAAKSNKTAASKTSQSDENSSLPFTIVGIGASAGGLEALSQLLHAMPADPKIALVIVQHMAPSRDSMLVHLLAEQTSISVSEVVDGIKVECNRVYVIPPNTEMAIAGGRLHLTPRPNMRTLSNPIDFFLQSLAGYARERAIGVILSGTASDGALGLREVKGAGGIAIVQDPKTAKFDGMPRAAIAAGDVDFVLPPNEIAMELVRIAARSAEICAPLSSEPQGDAEAVNSGLAPSPLQTTRIFKLLRNVSGVDFTHYKRPTLYRRLHRRMVMHKISNAEQYVRLLEQNPSEVTKLYQDMLIHVTRFFRDAESFQVLAAKVFPSLRDAARKGIAIRVWVPGCSTGEEAYSIAISLLEFLGDDADTQIQIFATDVSETAVENARAGIYPDSITADVSEERLRRFFRRVDGKYKVNTSVRDLCIFARQDITRDPPFSKLDLIVCRNVLIYLDSAIQKKLMTVFHYALRPNGYLMLGSAETIGSNSDMFATADKRHKLYTRRNASTPRDDMEFKPAEHATTQSDHRRLQHESSRGGTGVQQEANRVILSRYSPSGVIVDSELKIVQFRGQTGPYLEPAPGEASLSLLKMARDGLLYGLRTAIHDARKKDAVVRKTGLRVKVNGHVREVELEVIPLTAEEGRHFLILFHEAGANGHHAVPPVPPKSFAKTKSGRKSAAEHDGMQLKLQQELVASREYLQSIIQDLEAANEELQSANEEILSSNEELQSTNEELDTAKEELQSTNEELNTVNEELQGRNEELSRVNSDLVNLLGSVQIAIVIVSADLRIRRFTPMAEKVLNLIVGDVGRPISDIKPNINCPNLEKLIAEAIDTVTIKELETQDRNGNWYLLRIRPYKNMENRIDGAVLALFDVDSSHREAGNNAAVPEAVGDLMEGIAQPVLILDSHAIVRAANPVFREHFKVDDIVGRSIFDLAESKWTSQEFRGLVEKVLPREGRVEAGLAEARLESVDFGLHTVLHARRRSIGGELMVLIAFGGGKTS